MHICIVCKTGDPRILEYGSTLAGLMTTQAHEIRIIDRDLRTDHSPLFTEQSVPDLVVVIGGDGTVLLAVQRMPVQVPVVGINCGEVGFLADLDPGSAGSFLNAVRKPLATEPRMRIELSADGNLIGTALNEAVIVTERPAKMLKFLVQIDGILAERFRADGLLISTPTGSTAYAMSAGGPIVDPGIEGFLMVPLAPFMLSNRPHLISSEREVQISLETTKPARIVLDGQHEIRITSQTTIAVRRSDHPALFLHTGINFFEKINRKLRNL